MTRDEAIDVLKNSIWYYPPDVTSDEYDDRTDVYIAAEMAIEALKQNPQPNPETDDNFEPWLPNSRNQRCILPLMNLILKDDAEGVGK